MRFYVGVTDYDWFRLHASKPAVEEVNFWRPSPDAVFRALQTGEPFLFKLHAPRNYIAGGGFFTKFLQLPVTLAWEAFGEGNGARTCAEVRARIAKYRRAQIAPHDDPVIGCIILAEPFFWPERDWIPAPNDFSPRILAGKGYDTEERTGCVFWEQVSDRLRRMAAIRFETRPATATAIEGPRFGKPVTIMPRLGQGAFRVLVMDAYANRCAMTGERTLPVLEAAHIRRFSDGGPHQLQNGIFLRSDLHRLFDLGYATVNPDDWRILVSGRIREEFENGRDYYRLNGQPVALPRDPACIPSLENLRFHAEHVFR